MARILAISSQVARGNVGLSIIVPALQALGHEVMALPTVVLSNHPGHAHVAGTRIEPALLHQMLDALDANGWLAGVDGMLTGYLPSKQHVDFAVHAVGRVRAADNRQAFTYLCDPILGDDPNGLYIDEAAATAIRDDLIGLATLATPNRFELSYLVGLEIRSAGEANTRHLKCPGTFATSIPSDRPGETVNTMTFVNSGCARVPLRPDVPHGTGDLFSALLLSSWLDHGRDDMALEFATAGVHAVIAASHGLGQLDIAALPRRGGPVLTWPLELDARPMDGTRTRIAVAPGTR